MIFLLFTFRERNIVENNGPMTLLSSFMFHISGWNSTIGGIVRNETVVFMSEINENSFLSAIRKYQVSEFKFDVLKNKLYSLKYPLKKCPS